MVFVAFTLFAVLNVVTGTFVEHARNVTENDLDVVVQGELTRKRAYIRDVARMFHEADPGNTGYVNKSDFLNYLRDPSVEAFFSSLELGDGSSATELFNLLDRKSCGKLTLPEFTIG